jgi:hypothetical protein
MAQAERVTTAIRGPLSREQLLKSTTPRAGHTGGTSAGKPTRPTNRIISSSSLARRRSPSIGAGSPGRTSRAGFGIQ